jgi:RNA polymerase sigma factor (sigma-70 family)
MIGLVSAQELLEHAGFLEYHARAIAGNGQAADLIQDVWVAAFARPLRDLASAKSWLARVASNRAHELGRRGDRRKRREELVAHPEAQDSSESTLEEHETRRTVRELVFSLPERQRAVLFLRYYLELTPAGIAWQLAIGVGDVRRLHSSALAALRRRLRRCAAAPAPARRRAARAEGDHARG